jgi:hypothetical protein
MGRATNRPGYAPPVSNGDFSVDLPSTLSAEELGGAREEARSITLARFRALSGLELLLRMKPGLWRIRPRERAAHNAE